MKTLVGVAKDRAVIKAAAVRIIQEIIEQPLFDKLRPRELRHDWLAPPPLSAFRALEPLGFGLPDEDWWIFNPNDCTPDVVWPLNVGTVVESAGEDGGIAMSNSRTVTAKQVRGYASRYSPYMIRMDHAQMERGQLITASSLYVWLGGNWVDAQNRTMWAGEIPSKESRLLARDRDQPRLATGVALRQRYQWAVSLGLTNTPSIRFATDPTGIKDVFRIRDLPEGRDRRAALMTWVSDHWREDRNDPEMEVYVRRHLRGAVAFNWQGMECELLPSKFDLEQRDKLAAEREAMRITGTDKRARQ